MVAVPELLPALTEHAEYYEDVLPHVFFGDVTRYAVEILASEETDVLARLLSCLERGLASGDQDVDNLICVSFVENMQDSFPTLDAMRQHAGPLLKTAIDGFVNWRPSTKL